jgi:hypothetical protein
MFICFISNVSLAVGTFDLNLEILCRKFKVQVSIYINDLH